MGDYCLCIINCTNLLNCAQTNSKTLKMALILLCTAHILSKSTENAKFYAQKLADDKNCKLCFIEESLFKITQKFLDNSNDDFDVDERILKLHKKFYPDFYC